VTPCPAKVVSCPHCEALTFGPPTLTVLDGDGEEHPALECHSCGALVDALLHEVG
jgi:hypothetical protein